MSLRIVLIGAGSKEFGPATTRDVMLSDILAGRNIHLVLMDINPVELENHQKYAVEIAEKLNRNIIVSHTTSLEKALEGADFVITAIEIKRYYYWSQDFHIPRKYGFKQIYGENGGIGGIFHALRNFGPTHKIVTAMEQICPNAMLLNYTNPLTKLSELISRISSIKFVGLCHGVFQGKTQLAALLDRDVHSFNAEASGINHFSWFHSITDSDGNDLYPELKERESKAHLLSDWDEIALSRVLLRVYGLYPSPGANHIGEYVRWASGFLASQQLQYYYDPLEGDPWINKEIPTYLYNLNVRPTEIPFDKSLTNNALYPHDNKKNSEEICGSGELAIPIIEGISEGHEQYLDAVNLPNKNLLVPGLPKDAIVEVPAFVSSRGIEAKSMPTLPTGVLGFLHIQCSINKLLVEAYLEKSRLKLLQAVLLDPTVDSYSNAVMCVNEMCARQADVLPELKW